MTGRLIGMVHLGPLPGSPAAPPLRETIERAVADATVLVEAGFDAVMVENFGDAPFFADDVPKTTVAAMTVAVETVSQSVSKQVGVNVLRNDAEAALAVAAATGAAFIRVNVLSGAMWTDQGLITGRAAQVMRMRAAVAPAVSVLADVMVKHATPPHGLTIEQAARDLWERSGADGVVVSGTGTGSPLSPADLEAVHSAIPLAPLFAGSGADVTNITDLLSVCSGVIVGTATKVDGVTTNPVDPRRAAEIVEAAK